MRAKSAVPVKQWRTPVTPPPVTARPKNLGGIVLGVASVNDERQARLPGRLDMRFEPLALRRALGVVVVVVEPALANADHARM